jgi:hypothetical protein
MESLPTTTDQVLTRYRNRDIREADLELIRAKIEAVKGQRGVRGVIAATICQAWDWRQPSGTLAKRACSDLLLRLEEWGHIKLPPGRGRGNPPRRRLPVLPDELIPLTGLEVRGDEVDLDSLVVRPITKDELQGWRIYMGRYHYLGYRPIVGEHLLYAAFLDCELVALLGWGSAVFRAPLREAYIGWDDSAKRKRLQLVANNVRFLVLPWVRVPHLASKVLGANLRRLSRDWEQKWGHPVHLAETFVDKRFRGTCYRASNWLYLGQTAGRSKRGNAYLYNGKPKALFVYPLHRQAKRLLAGGASVADVVLPVSSADRLITRQQSTSSSDSSLAIGGASQEDARLPECTFVPPSAQLPQETTKTKSRVAIIAIITAGLLSLRNKPEKPATDLIGVGPEFPAINIVKANPDDASSKPEILRIAPTPLRGSNKTPLQIVLTDDEKSILEMQARALVVSHRTVIRSKIILLLAEGQTISAIARKLDLDRNTVHKWGERFTRKRLAGLEDDERSGHPARFSPRNRNSIGQARM